MNGELWGFFEGDFTAFGGYGIGLCAVLLLALRVVVPRPQKHVVRAPLLMFLLSIGFTIVNFALPGGPSSGLHGTLRLIGEALLLFAIARAFYLLILYGIFERRRTRTRMLSGIFRDIVQVAIYVIATVVTLKEAGVETGSLFTTSALLTAVIGLSLQDTLGNLFAGLAIQVQQPFEVGDWIQFDQDGGHIGEVVEINWRATRMITVDRLEVTVPNNTLAKAAISNYSRPTRLVRRSATIVGPYDSPPARVQRVLKESVVEVDGVVAHPAPDVQTLAFGERGVEYRVRYFIEDFDQREVIDSRVRDRLWYAMRRGGLAIPPPQRSVRMVESHLAADHGATIAQIERSLSRLPIFTVLPDELMHEVGMHTERRLYAPGEIVIQQGDVGTELFVIERGALDILIDTHDGMQHIASVGEGDVFGEMSLLTGAERSATVRTTVESTLLVVSKETLQPVLEASPELAEKISEVVAAREALLEAGRTSLEPSNSKVTERSSELLGRIREFFSI